MSLLSLDTSTDRAAVAVATATGTVHVASPDPARRHGRNLIPTIRLLLREAGLTLGDLDGFAVGLGPGSYTGLRIGVTAAKTFAYATGKPLVGLDSLEVIARNAPTDAQHVLVVADAQRGDLYVTEFLRSGPSEPLVRTAPTQIEPLSVVSARLTETTFVLGPAVEQVRTALPSLLYSTESQANWPDGRQLAQLAHDVWATGRRDDPWFLEPLYLRRSAAEDQWERRM